MLVLDFDKLKRFWAPAFTHKSFNESKSGDYESLESYGDLVLKSVFIEVVTQYFKRDLTNVEINYFNAKYMSKEHQAQLSERLGLDKYVRYDPSIPNITKSIKEDVFESFIGALYKATNSVFGMYTGMAIVHNFLAEVFKDYTFSAEEVTRDPVSLLKELYDKFGWGEVRYERGVSDRPDLGEVKSVVINAVGQTIGIGYGDNETSKPKAADSAYKYLIKEGHTLEVATAEATERHRKQNEQYNKQYGRAEKAFIRQQSAMNVKGKNAPIKFEVLSHGQVKKDDKQHFTYSLSIAFPGEDPTAPNKPRWIEVVKETGTQPMPLQISLLKSYADMFGIPE
jgi:dsRNA-specific ribonuclease